MAAAGLVGYAGYEAAEMAEAVFQLIYHSGVENNDASRKQRRNKSRFRNILQDAMKTTGFGLHDIAESAKQEIRMFQGTPGGGIDVLPEMLKSAAIEARLKGESPEESMKALVGLAHMTKQYDPEQIKKLAPAFAFLSTANPGSLSSIERAAGYARPDGRALARHRIDARRGDLDQVRYLAASDGATRDAGVGLSVQESLRGA
jgi:hypothetical protein